MKIAVFTDSFFPSGGGTEMAVYKLCNELINLGHKILLFAPDYHCEQRFDEFEVFRVRSLKLSANDMAVLYKLDYKKIVKKVEEFKPDIIHFCTASGMASCAVKIAKKFKKPLIATIHTKFREAFYNGCKSKLITFLMIKSLVKKLDKADSVVTVSNDMKNQLSDYGYKGDVKVIKNGVNGFNIISKDCEKASNQLNFMYCGHLIKIKNIQFSLKCLGALKRDYNIKKFKFILVGEGNYKKKLIKLAQKEGLSENVEFAGFISDRKKLAEIYKNSFLFLFPSTFDTDGLVLCEAANMGTPSLTIEGYGPSERIENNQTGFISKNNIKDYTDRIYEIINNKSLYDYVCKNVGNIKGKSWREIAIEYEALFNEYLNK